MLSTQLDQVGGGAERRSWSICQCSPHRCVPTCLFICAGQAGRRRSVPWPSASGHVDVPTPVVHFWLALVRDVPASSHHNLTHRFLPSVICQGRAPMAVICQGRAPMSFLLV